MFNTIILKCGNTRLTNDDMERFEKYDTICGNKHGAGGVPGSSWEIRKISRNTKMIFIGTLKRSNMPKRWKN